MLFRTFILREEVNASALWSFLKANWRDTAKDGKPLAVTVQEYKAKRSGDQNRYYWQRLNEIAEQAWIGGRQFSADAWHEHTSSGSSWAAKTCHTAAHRVYRQRACRWPSLPSTSARSRRMRRLSLASNSANCNKM